LKCFPSEAHSEDSHLDQGPQKISGDACRRLLVQQGKGERAGAIYGDKYVKLTLWGQHLGDKAKMMASSSMVRTVDFASVHFAAKNAPSNTGTKHLTPFGAG
jgi:hypothetical protein